MSSKLYLCVATALSLGLSPFPAVAYQICPEASAHSRKITSYESWLNKIFDKATPIVAHLISDPIHERITHQIYGCEIKEDVCSKPKKPHSYAPDAVIAGVRWNDNPPFQLDPNKTSLKECAGMTIQLPNYGKCWKKLLSDAEKRAKKGEVFDAKSGTVLINRVHFGDLQFLHSMASRDGEAPEFTLRRIMMWAEFTYRVALGEFKRDTELRRTGIAGMETLFGNKGWTVQQLFTMGDTTYRGKKDFGDLAFGSLLHMIQDSFSLSHTDRDEPTGGYCEKAPEILKPGRILNFHAYGQQDSKKHGEKDTHDALGTHLESAQPNVVDVGKTLLAYYNERRPWDQVKGYLECVFELHEEATVAGPGVLFVKEQ